jgi:hypothetical protein
MNDYLSRFIESPASFKKSFVLLVVAWVCHPLFLYSIFLSSDAVEGSEKLILRMVVVSLSLCVLLFLIKKWARALVVLGTFFIVVNDILYFVITPHSKISTLLCVVVVSSAVVGTYWLFVKDSREYFKIVNPADDSPEPPKMGTSPDRPR